VADDRSSRELLALAVDIAHQMLIHVCLPRHFSSFLCLFLSFFFFFFFFYFVCCGEELSLSLFSASFFVVVRMVCVV
jgi:hypothetical protein